MPQVEWCAGLMDTLAPTSAIASAVREEQLVLGSLHASFRETARSKGTNDLPFEGQSLPRRVIGGLIRGPVGRLLSRDIYGSAQAMGEIKVALGEEKASTLLHVMYPFADRALDRAARREAGSGPKVFQPTDHLAARRNLTSAQRFHNGMVVEDQYDGYVLDTAHLHPQRYGGRYFQALTKNLEKSLEVFGPHTRAVHFALGRTDLTPGSEAFQHDTRRDLIDALQGNFSGVVRQVMEAARHHDITYGVLEVPARSIASVLRQRYPGVSRFDRGDYAEIYRTLGLAISEAMNTQSRIS